MKYLFINDIEFTLHKRKKIIFIFYLLITVSLWLRSFDFENFTTYLGTSLGMTLNLEKYELIDLLMYLLNISVFIFLMVDIYVKDICYNLDNLFLRIKPLKWIFKKNISFMIFMFFLKSFEYILILVLSKIFCNGNLVIIELLHFFIKDIFYILFLQFFFLSFYLIFNILKINANYSIILLIIFLFFFDKNIYQCSMIKIFIGICISLSITLFLFYKKGKKIIEVNRR